jgi:uncharacterized protein (DUF1800 family)
VNRETVIAVNRFGLGAAPGELGAAAADPRGWLAAQASKAPDYEALAGLPPSSEAVTEFPRWVRQRFRDRRAANGDGAMQDGESRMGRGIEESFRDHFLPMMLKEVGARLAVGASTPVPFHERLVWFWANHFTVSAQKPAIFAVVGSFEREAIRPHVGGRFVDMLLASSKHPAMILYLDNQLSVRPGWKPPARVQAPNLPRPTGLNENLAREILELHTLGVHGGYTQDDVTTFARVLTGWTVGGLARPGFLFAPPRHDPGPKTILGKTYAQEGMAQGEAVLRDLAAHPATATHVATKLARHFIADEPPPAAVERIARAFRDSGGHLPTVHAALLACPEAWETPLAKLKSPNEYIVSCLRALPPARQAKPQALYLALHEMGQRPFSAPSPQGWPDTSEAWAGADALWKRIEWAGILASRLGSGVDPLALARDSYGDAVSEPTRLAIARAESRQQGLARWLASPEFQRR